MRCTFQHALKRLRNELIVLKDIFQKRNFNILLIYVVLTINSLKKIIIESQSYFVVFESKVLARTNAEIVI